jgi:hypothetical protein
MIKKYKMLGGNLNGQGPLVTFASVETAIDKIPDPRLVNHVQLPPHTSRDIITLGAKYVESRDNLNRAWFANDELLAAYHTIPYKALDIEHEVEQVVGHIYSSVFINRATGQAMDPEAMKAMDPKVLSEIMIDVIIGGVTYIDRFPRLESPVSTKAFKISMETYFDSFDIMLDNGTRVTLEEAESFGLGPFIDQLMGSFESVEEFERAHSLLVITSDNKQKEMKIYKYLKGLLFSGGGLVLNPACPSCHILTTSCDCEDAKGEQANMKTESKITQFSLDLRKVDSYMKDIRDNKGGKPTVTQVKEELENTEVADVPADNRPGDPPRPTPPATMPPPSSVSPTPNDQTSKHAPCPNYMLDQDMACLFADKQCLVAGSRDDKSCYRWIEDERGHWKFDSRNHIKDAEEVVINEVMEGDEASLEGKQRRLDWLSKKIEQMEMSLEYFKLQRDSERGN